MKGDLGKILKAILEMELYWDPSAPSPPLKYKIFTETRQAEVSGWLPPTFLHSSLTQTHHHHRLSKTGLRGDFCQDAKPTVSSDTHVSGYSPTTPRLQPLSGCPQGRGDSRCLRGAGGGPRRSFAHLWELIKYFLCQEREVERRGFAATVWKSQRLSLKGLKTAPQRERGSRPREAGKNVPSPYARKLR